MSLTNTNTNTHDNNICKPNLFLLCSTSTFIFPMIYSYSKNHTMLLFMTAIALFGSLNYWRKPCLGNRRNIDLVTSKLSCSMYIWYGYNYIHRFWPLCISWINLYLIYYFYNKSCQHFNIKNDQWIYYHAIFHIIITISKTHIIYFTEFN